MSDLLVSLYSAKLAELRGKADSVGITIRPALPPELHVVIGWVREHFSENWASEVAVVSSKRWALMHELRYEEEPRLTEIIAKMASCDLILTEGYKGESHAKIEVRDVALNHPELAGRDPSVIAIASNGAVKEVRVPVFDRDDVKSIADFIVERLELGPR